ncbi:hypothetical protein [Pseudomonas aeruginosa]
MHYGKRALAHLRLELPLQVLMSNAGFYIGTLDEEGQGVVFSIIWRSS